MFTAMVIVGYRRMNVAMHVSFGPLINGSLWLSLVIVEWMLSCTFHLAP